MSEYRYYDGTLRQGYFCVNCGQTINMVATGHYYKISKIHAWTCESNPVLVGRLRRANPPPGVKPHFTYIHKKAK